MKIEFCCNIMEKAMKDGLVELDQDTLVAAAGEMKIRMSNCPFCGKKVEYVAAPAANNAIAKGGIDIVKKEEVLIDTLIKTIDTEPSVIKPLNVVPPQLQGIAQAPSVGAPVKNNLV